MCCGVGWGVISYYQLRFNVLLIFLEEAVCQIFPLSFPHVLVLGVSSLFQLLCPESERLTCMEGSGEKDRMMAEPSDSQEFAELWLQNLM